MNPGIVFLCFVLFYSILSYKLTHFLVKILMLRSPIISHYSTLIEGVSCVPERSEERRVGKEC